MKRIRVVFIVIAAMLLLTGCGSSSASGIKRAAQAAYQAAGSPDDAEKVSVYHFHGHDELDARTDLTLDETFDIKAEQVPENGYLFIFQGNKDKYIFVLMDEKCAVVKCINYAELTAYADSRSERTKTQTKQLNADFKAGKISTSEMEKQKSEIQAQLNVNIKIDEQCKALLTYVFASITMGDPYDEDVINTWHNLTPELVSSLR